MYLPTATFVFISSLFIGHGQLREFPINEFFGLSSDFRLDREDILNMNSYLCSFGEEVGNGRKGKCCSCRDSCTTFNNCCIDKYWRNATDSNVSLSSYLEDFVDRMEKERLEYTCVSLVEKKFLKESKTFLYFMMTSCNKHQILSKEDKQKCEMSNYKSFSETIPVVGSEDGILYRSAACARCNSISKFRYVTVTAKCPIGYGNNDEKTIKDDLTGCTYRITEDFDESISRCHNYIYPQERCNNTNFQKLCASYIGSMNHGKYPNVHCYWCDGKMMNPKKPSFGSGEECSTISKSRFWSFTIDFSGMVKYTQSKTKKHSRQCPEGEIMDVFAQACFPPDNGGNGGLSITPTVSNTERILSEVNSYIVNYLTISSLIGYFVVIILYSILKELHNIPGYNALAMSTFLFLTDGVFLLGNIESHQSSAYCKYIGILFHWLLLASQMWTTIICVDLAITIHSSVSMATRSKSKWLKIYFIVALVSPLLFVVPAVVLNETGVVDVGYRYKCLIQDLTTRIWSYIVPVALQNFVCVCLLIKTMRLVHVEKRESKKTLGSSQKNIGIVKIALKLTVGLGLIEVLGLVQVVKHNDMTVKLALATLYNIVRSLKGEFVCFLFVGNKKVIRLCKTKFACMKGVAGDGSDYSATNRSTIELDEK